MQPAFQPRSQKLIVAVLFTARVTNRLVVGSDR